MKIRTAVIIPSAGRGSRMGGVRKNMLVLKGEAVLARVVAVFEASELVEEIIVVAAPDDVDDCRALLERANAMRKVTAVVPGGAERQDSVTSGLNAVSKDVDVIAVHDGARPLVTPEIIEAVLLCAASYGAAVAAVPLKDTIKEMAPGTDFVRRTVPRDTLRAVQTPQAFRADVIRRAYAEAAREGFVGTDCASLVERMGVAVRLAQGSYENIKITTPDDLLLAGMILDRRAGTASPAKERHGMRIGHGYDVHRFAAGRRLVLGGVEIAHEKGLLGHSDADALLHAVIDAIFGAAALGDIGAHFPPTDPAYRDISSLKLLGEAAALIRARGLEVSNVDATVVCEEPRLLPHVPAMRARIAEVLAIDPSRVSVKATTEEGLGFTGAGDGLAAHAVVILEEAWR